MRRDDFFASCPINGRRPGRVTTDRHPAYRKAIRRILGRNVMHRRDQYLNYQMEQDHRAIMQRHYPMLGFGSFATASHFCVAFDALRQYFRLRRRCGEQVSLGCPTVGRAMAGAGRGDGRSVVLTSAAIAILLAGCLATPQIAPRPDRTGQPHATH